ncbi:MAG: deoxyribodipyrimidine photo-lyase [Candidatus Nanohaloarchaea archaeon]|nr:deoxyribodipyrimidine photo-lyase [Candidatus Nanohaloarchaea archaeon]
MTAIAWLRREMRVHDNTALVEAARDHDEVVPLYVVDEDYFENGDADYLELGYPRVKFWHESLKELRSLLGKRGADLVVRQGSPVEELKRVVEEAEADAVYVNEDYTPYSKERDGRAEEQLEVPFKSFTDVMMHPPDSIQTSKGTPYKVFTYYWRKWKDREKPEPREVREFQVPDVGSGEIPALEEIGYEDRGLEWWEGGREAGMERLENFIGKIGEYEERRDFPAEDATSKLSPHLKFGTVSVREVFQAAEEAREDGADEEGVETWEQELAWRDFYFQALHHWPETVEKAFLEQYRGMDWEEDGERWERFVEGRTGYPFVDAGMRQLNATGWMHNRLRMVVTSFCAKDLHLDWRKLHDHFSRMFVDAELSSMVGGIQWAYSIGTDAQPYFRVFNPWTQGERYDPEGEFIREWVPELEDVPDEHVHRPHEMPEEVQEESGCVIGEDYPEPVVDHDEEREKAVEMFEEARE